MHAASPGAPASATSAAARALAGETVAGVYGCTTPRARRTAELLAAALATEVAALPELVEADVGEAMLRAWVVERDLGRRAEDGESGWQVVARVAAAFQAIAGAHPGQARPTRAAARRPDPEEHHPAHRSSASFSVAS